MRWLLTLTLCVPLYVHSGTIYLCKAYNGGTFWSKATCHQHQALIDRIVSVPDSLPFEQQVRLAEQERSQRDSLTSGNVRQAQPSAQRPEQAECQGLSAQAAQYDAMARQPQSGQMQDWITAEKRKVRDRQYALHC